MNHRANARTRTPIGTGRWRTAIAIGVIAWTAAQVVAGTAAAQGTPYVHETANVALVVPADWAVTEARDPSGSVVLQFDAPREAGLVVVAVTPITAADRAYWSGPTDDLLTDVWNGFLPELPGAQVVRRYDVEAAGRSLRALDYSAPTVSGSIMLLVAATDAFTIASVAVPDGEATVAAGLGTIVQSVGPARAPQADAPGAPSGSGAGGNPLDTGGAAPGAGTNPLDTGSAAPGGGANPLDTGSTAPGTDADPLDTGSAAPGTGTNPLDAQPAAPPDTQASAAESFVGTFVGERVQLELAPATGGLAGTLTVDGAVYPARAVPVGDGLQGTFAVDGSEFAFVVEREGDTLWLTSEGARFEVRRQP